MPPIPHESPSVSVCRRGSADPGSDPLRVVVWVRGDHDLATRAHLSVTIARAARLDDADVDVDLSGVTFMDASTVSALVLARNRLRARSRSLSVRAPSPGARRLLDLCGLDGMIDELPTPLRSTAPALDSWVTVPATGRAPGAARPAVLREASRSEPARATATRRIEPTGSGLARRAPS